MHLKTITLLALPAALVAAPPAQAPGPDAKICEQAQNTYNFKTYLKDDAITVACREGVVTLKGTVADDFHKALAADTVAGIPGVQRVVNDLESRSGDQKPDSDGWLGIKVKTALLFQKEVSGTGTEVQAEEGVVTLRGIAPTQALKDRTTECAREVDGVKDVKNEMTLAPKDWKAPRTVAGKIDDASVTAQVKTSLLFHRKTRMMATRILTRDGAVVIHGQARNADEKNLVSRLVADIGGVRSVDNRMTLPAE